MSGGALEGVRVLDLGRFPPTAYCTQMLVQLGADVCRVDAPGSNPAAFGQGIGLSAGKRSIALDQRHERGPEVLRRLAQWADVLVENERPGVMDSRGFGPTEAADRLPSLIWCSITGFGQDGPYSRWPGHDLTYTAQSGLLDALHSELPWHPQTMLSVPLGALMAVIGITTSLYRRQTNHRGCHLDISLAESATWLLTGLEGLLNGGGMRIPASPDRRLYQCGDQKWVSVAAADPRTWAALCTGLGLEEMAPDLPNPMDPASWPPIVARLSAVFATRPAAQWVAELGASGAAVGPTNTPADLQGDPHVQGRAGLVDVEGTKVPVNPVRVRGSKSPVTSTAPRVGADTRVMLEDVGYSDKEIELLLAERVATEA